MAIIKSLGELSNLISAGQTLQKMSETGVQIVQNPSQNSGDGWQRFERIITGINELLDKATQFKNAQGSQTIIESPAKQIHHAPPVYSPARTQVNNAQNANNEGTQKAMKQVIEFLAKHINECAKENPNMSLGEAINKLPINVTQIGVLLQLYLQKQGG